ncbi:MAG: hypothetical protein GY719_35075, partial [bacterium]|nr:hypothetical protein [bacterium]
MRKSADGQELIHGGKSAKATSAARAPATPGRDVHPMVKLQRLIGNRAVGRLLQPQTENSEGAEPSSLDRAPTVDFPREVREIARRGVIGADQPLPHLGRIQRAFGPEHDLSRVRFQAGGEAETANRALGAR